MSLTKKISKRHILVIILILAGVSALLRQKFYHSDENNTPITTEELKVDTIPLAENFISVFGVDYKLDSIAYFSVKRGETFQIILRNIYQDTKLAYEIEQNLVDIFPPTRLRYKQDYALGYKAVNDSITEKYFFIEYENEVISINDSGAIQTKVVPYEIKREYVGGEITHSLWQTLTDEGLPAVFTAKIANIFDHQIDFYRLQKGDKFKVVADVKYLGDKRESVEFIPYAEFEHEGELFEGLYFDSESGEGYYNKEGKSLKTAFLKSPLEFGRISSRYNPRRYHPVLKRIKAHKGTDYAAPHGTPIRSVADGTILTASYTRGNGNYVKVKHNNSVTTQYLHMSKFASGIKKGRKVKQGETIGYVGSTGLATGPHVCFRYWLNGKQVDHLKIQSPPSYPIKESEKTRFNQQLQDFKLALEENTSDPS